MLPLEEILSRTYPRFNLGLIEPQVVIEDNPLSLRSDGYDGSVDFTYKPDIFDKSETRYLEKVIFRISPKLSEDERSATAYFAHECSHLELLKKSYHVGYFFAMTLANMAISSYKERNRGKRYHSLNFIDKAKMLLQLGLALAVYVPLAAYGNLVERVVDNNAKAKGFDKEINALREKCPLKIFI